MYPFLCRAVRIFAKDRGGVSVEKEYYVSLVEYPSAVRVRQLTTDRVGQLLRITGQVVRSHPVHPELVTGTFVCLECQTVIRDVEQQFKVRGERAVTQRGGRERIIHVMEDCR